MANAPLFSASELFLFRQMVEVTKRSMNRAAQGKSPEFQALYKRDKKLLDDIEEKFEANSAK